MSIEKRTLKLIAYGKGKILKPELIEPIKNRNFIKPDGGLWTSPVDSKYDWKEWCRDEEFCLDRFDTFFEFEYSGNILVVDCESDLDDMVWYKFAGPLAYPDFEKILKSGVNAIFLTEKGQWDTRFSHPKNLYGWDCECVLMKKSKT